MNPQEQAARKLIDNLRRVPGGVFSRGHSHDENLPIGAWCAEAVIALEKAIALESQLSQARSELKAKSWPQIKVEAINAMEIQAQELIRRAEKAELALSQAQAELTQLRQQLANVPVGIGTIRYTTTSREGQGPSSIPEDVYKRAALKEGEKYGD